MTLFAGIMDGVNGAAKGKTIPTMPIRPASINMYQALTGGAGFAIAKNTNIQI